MKLDVEELARRSGIRVDTIRYYQSNGLLHPPRREGRRAVYDETHLERLERVRALADRGFSLKAIAALFEAGDEGISDRLLLDAVEQARAARYSAKEVAERVGVSPSIIDAIERAGLVEGDPENAASRRRYSPADLRVARAAAKLLGYGFPFTRLLRLAIRHDRAVKKTVDEAIDLFDDHIRKAGEADADPEAVARAFRDLLPVVTALVAHHFERTLVNRALSRLQKSGRRSTYRKALQAARSLAARSRQAR